MVEHTVSGVYSWRVELSRSQPAKEDLQQMVNWDITSATHAHTTVEA